MALQNFPRRFGRLCFLCSSDGFPVHASAVARVAPIRTAGRPFSDDQSHVELKGQGTVVGCYDNSGGGPVWTEVGEAVDAQTGGKLRLLLEIATGGSGKVKKGDSVLLHGLNDQHTHVAVVGLGEKGQRSENEAFMEDIDVGRQGVRCAAAVGARCLQKAGVKDIWMDHFGDAEASAEGSALGLFKYAGLKSKEKTKEVPSLKLWSSSPPLLQDAWGRGLSLASAQNFARELMETPSNLMTPALFVEAVSMRVKDACSLSPPSHQGGIEVIPRPLSWIKSQRMGAFLSVARGSNEDPWFLELRYNFGKEKKTTGEEEEGENSPPPPPPLVLVGKGVTFDTGGISIKPSANMALMRADMGGAACVAAATVAVASLGLPISLLTLIPLCENMPSGCAVKPGDVVTAMNGKTIEVDNTDAEGRLLLADALCYAQSFSPSAMVDVATLTGAIDVALGSGAAAVFTNSASLGEQLCKAGRETGDRLWRMPLFRQYSKQIESRIADINNIGSRGRSAGACTAAAFLKEFVGTERSWAHIDMAGVMESYDEEPFLAKGMSGRPTRTLIKFLEQFQQQ